MSYFNTLHDDEQERSELRRALVALAVFAVFTILFSLLPRLDPTKVVAGIPCSVLSESEIGSVLGTPVHLMPTSGTVCQYVSTGSGPQVSLFVVARHSSIPELGGAASEGGQALYVRNGTRAYSFDVIAHSETAATVESQKRQLAQRIHKSVIAQTQ